MTIVASTRLGACRVRFRRGLGASQTCLGRVLAALGLLLGSSWTLLGVSWAPFASFMDALGCLRHGFSVMHELLRSTARHSTAQGQH